MKTYLNKILMVSGILLVLTFQNCSPFKAVQFSGGKGAVVSRTVFVEDDDLGRDCVTDGTCGQPEVDDTSKSLEIPVHYYCSRNWTDIQEGMNIQTATSLKVAFVDAQDQIKCEISGADIRDGVVNQKKILARLQSGVCPQLVSGVYTMLVVDATRTVNPDSKVSITKRSMVIGNGDHDRPKPYYVELVVNSKGPIGVTSVNVNNGVVQVEAANDPYILWKNADDGKSNELCEVRNSPLVIQLTPRPRKIRLVEPLLGVLFDIMGINDSPAHQKRQISWFNAGDAVSHYWITLPNTAGRVDGIDEMFGNNTVGPDGKTTTDGYAALRKWDGRRLNGTYDARARDGKITAADPIFNQLRYWSDRNVNGVAETYEMYGAQELGIKMIDLEYDRHFAETDKWGNEIKMKSVVETQDGGLFLMYDIWFRHAN